MFCLSPDAGYAETLIEGAFNEMRLTQMDDTKLDIYKWIVNKIWAWAGAEHSRIIKEEDRRGLMEELRDVS